MNKINLFFWPVTGIGVGTVLGFAVNNIPAGVSLGIGCGLLALLLSFLQK
jgi:hypothetical protein